MDLSKLFGNKSMQNILLGQFKKVVIEEGYKGIFIKTNENGEFTVEYYKNEIIVLDKEEYNKLIDALKSNL